MTGSAQRSTDMLNILILGAAGDSARVAGSRCGVTLHIRISFMST
jgi:hypothetical protein